MLQILRSRVAEAIRVAVADVTGEQIELPVVEDPPRPEVGDLACAIALQLSKKLGRNPRELAQQLVERLEATAVAGVLSWSIAGPGFLNARLDRGAALLTLIDGLGSDVPEARREKVLIEHTSVNPNKAAHVGHLRNACMGDTLAKICAAVGHPIEVHNYIDDTGVQVADVVVGFRELESKTLGDIRDLADTTRFDYYCWDLYAKVTDWYAADDTRLESRRQALRELEHGGNATAETAAVIADRIARCHLATMDRLNVEYDLLSWEGDILRLDFWSTAFDILKDAGAVFLQDIGKQAGCWVMEVEDGQPAVGDGAATAEETRYKVIVRSDGTVTYIGKDIAYQLWKFGLLGKDFQFRQLPTQRSGRPLWATTALAPASDDVEPRPEFGRGSTVYNVIDTRQAYLQQLLKQALNALGHPQEAERSIHFSYEMVALSHNTARALGYDASAAEGRPFVEVSGRKGLGVKADDLLDRLSAAAATEVRNRNADLDEREVNTIASTIAVAAVRYFMVKYSRGKVIAFDIDEALSFEGESGPYLQYAAVRAGNILRKLEAKDGTQEQDVVNRLADLSAEPLDDPDGTDLWALVLEASRLDEVAEQAVRTLELSVVAKYAFGLAQSFNAFYHRYPVIKEPDPEVRLWRAAAVSYFKTQLTRALDLMGCQVPSRM